MAQMDADTDHEPPQHASTSSSSPALIHPRNPSYRIFLGDTQGALKTFYAQCASLPDDFQPPLPQLVHILGHQSHHSSTTAEARAVQKMASGHLDGVGWVIAIARKDATIDVVLPSAADDPSRHDSASSQQQPQQQQEEAVLLASITNDNMKPGLQRWVGLAVGAQGIYACTSAGHFLYATLSLDRDATSSSSTHPNVQISKIERLTLPEPLQALVFHPSANPTHFVYGGEEIPLSLWHLQTAFSPQQGSSDDVPDEDHIPEGGQAAHANGLGNGEVSTAMNAKLRKRKRQAEARAKAKELLWGEVWRAKNLPNDALSLPQRPNILSISVLPTAKTSCGSPLSQEEDSPSVIPALTVLVGTRDGLIRTFEPASGVRKHTKDVRVVLPGEGALKLLTCPDFNEGEVVAADSSGKLYAVDMASDVGRVKYQWKDITGAITSALPLPAPCSSPRGTTSESSSADNPSLLFTSSFDRLLRLHTLPSAPPHLVKGYHARGKNLYSAFTGGAGVVATVWDGLVPALPEESEGDGDESMRSSRKNRHGGHDCRAEEDEDEDEDDVWQAMQEIGASEPSSPPSSAVGGAARQEGSRRASGDTPSSGTRSKMVGQRHAEGDGELDVDEEKIKEGRRKRGKKDNDE